MPLRDDHDRSSLCRNCLTRRPGLLALALVFASPLGRLAVLGGTLGLGSGCGAPSYAECEDMYVECRAYCPESGGEECRLACYAEYEMCLDEADLAAQRRESAAVAADIGLSCAAALCSFEGGDGDGDGDGGEDEWSDPEPDPNDDWGEDWGERVGDDEGEILPPLPDIPE